MPLFAIAIVYGLLWKRATETGALAAYLVGVAAGIVTAFQFEGGIALTTFASAGVALIVCPLVSMFTKQVKQEKIEKIWQAKKISEEEIASGEIWHIIPQSVIGKISLVILALGVVGFIAGALTGMYNPRLASIIAVSGMLVYFAGGLLRLYTK